MGQSKKPLKVIKAEISQMFATLPPEEQRVAIERLEELMEENKGLEATERFRRLVLAELITMQTRH